MKKLSSNHYFHTEQPDILIPAAQPLPCPYFQKTAAIHPHTVCPSASHPSPFFQDNHRDNNLFQKTSLTATIGEHVWSSAVSIISLINLIAKGRHGPDRTKAMPK